MSHESRALDHAHSSLPPPDTARLNDPSLHHPPHTDLKHCALHQLGCQMLHALMVVRNQIAGAADCDAEPRLPHGFLGWSLEDCQRRLPLSSVWLSVLLKQRDPGSFEVQKATIDLDELMDFIKLILRSYLRPDQGAADVHDKLRQAQDYIHLEQTMREELEENSQIVRQEFFHILTLQFEHRTSIKRCTHMGQWVTDHNVIVPIKMRHNAAFNAGLCEQNELQCRRVENALDGQVEWWLKRIERENLCFQWAMVQYYKEIDSMRLRLEEMAAMYERDHDRMVNQVEYKNASLEKLRVQQLYHEEEIRRFREEVQRVQEQEAQQLKAEAKAKAKAAASTATTAPTATSARPAAAPAAATGRGKRRKNPRRAQVTRK